MENENIETYKQKWSELTILEKDKIINCLDDSSSLKITTKELEEWFEGDPNSFEIKR